MAQTYTDINVNQLIINKLTKQEYDNLQQVSDTELYLVEEQVDSVVTQNSTNPVQSGAVYEALQDIGGNINDGTTIFTKNNETIGTTSANQENDKTIAIPNDVVMCKILENRALASYATPITRFKYIEDHGWVDMDRSDIQYNEGTGEWTGTFVSLDITEGEYYYDIDNEAVFVADENSEMQDVTSTVVIQDDINKLYCDVDTNILYRYNGSNFITLTSEGKTYTLSSSNENIRLTDSDGQTQDLSLNTLINGLSTGSSDPHDDDYIVSQYAGGGTTTTTYHRRPLSKFWNWIKSKLGIGTNDGTFLRKDGTWATPTDTKATVTTTGSGNAITSLTASNGALTATKGSTFLTSHQDISGKVNKSGDTITGTLILSKTQDASGITNNKPALIIGGTDTQAHIEIDNNEIIAKSNGTTGTTLYLNDGYGSIGLCGSDYSVKNPAKFRTAIGAGTSSLAIGTTSSTAAAGNHTHTTTIATSSGTNQITLAASTKYAITAGGTSYVFTTPPNTNTTYSAGTGLSLSSTTFSVSYGTKAGTACQGNDSRLSNSRPASDVYTWAKSASLAAAMQSSITSGAITSGTNCTCSVSWQQVGNLVSFTGYIKPNSSYSASQLVRVAAPGTYKQTVYFGAMQTNKSAIFRLTATTGFLENEGPVTNETYYFQVIGIRVI